MLGRVALSGIGDVFLVEGIVTCRFLEPCAERPGRLRGAQLVLVNGKERYVDGEREATLMSGECVTKVITMVASRVALKPSKSTAVAI